MFDVNDLANVCIEHISEVIYGLSRVALWRDAVEKLHQCFFHSSTLVSVCVSFFRRLLHLFAKHFSSLLLFQHANRIGIFYFVFIHLGILSENQKNMSYKFTIILMMAHFNVWKTLSKFWTTICHDDDDARRDARVQNAQTQFTFKRMSIDFIVFFLLVTGLH